MLGSWNCDGRWKMKFCVCGCCFCACGGIDRGLKSGSHSITRRRYSLHFHSICPHRTVWDWLPVPEHPYCTPQPKTVGIRAANSASDHPTHSEISKMCHAMADTWWSPLPCPIWRHVDKIRISISNPCWSRRTNTFAPIRCARPNPCK